MMLVPHDWTGKTVCNDREIVWAETFLFFKADVSGGWAVWQDYLAFDLPRRTYFRRRGFASWARDVVSGDFADFSHIQVDGGDPESEDILFYVSLVWAETVGRRGCRRFHLGQVETAEKAAALAADLAVPLNIPIQGKWLRPPIYVGPAQDKPDPNQPGIIQMPPGSHSVAAAAVMALLVTGGGQMVNKQTTKGVVILISAFVLTALTFVLTALTLGLAWPSICLVSFTLVSLIDAVCIANRLNRGEPVGSWQWF
jgi:hypothetical protein